MTAILQGDNISSFTELGDETTEDDESQALGEQVEPPRKKSPYVTLRGILDSSSYDPVRDILKRSEEGILKYYRWIKYLHGLWFLI